MFVPLTQYAEKILQAGKYMNVARDLSDNYRRSETVNIPFSLDHQVRKPEIFCMEMLTILGIPANNRGSIFACQPTSSPLLKPNLQSQRSTEVVYQAYLCQSHTVQVNS